MKKIYLIRHGQTDFNLKGILQGSNVDEGLNETGRKQALAFYKSHCQIPFDKIYTSALRRTIQTVEPFIDLGIPHESLDSLNEINFGDEDGVGHSRGEETLYRKMVREWDAGNTNLSFPNGECPDQVKQRQKSFIDKLKSDTESEFILVCMHGRAMRILLANLLNLPLTEMNQFSHSNLSLYVLSFDGEKFLIERKNDLSHLNVIKALEEKQEIL